MSPKQCKRTALNSFYCCSYKFGIVGSTEVAPRPSVVVWLWLGLEPGSVWSKSSGKPNAQKNMQLGVSTVHLPKELNPFFPHVTTGICSSDSCLCVCCICFDQTSGYRIVCLNIINMQKIGECNLKLAVLNKSDNFATVGKISNPRFCIERFFCFCRPIVKTDKPVKK